MSDPNFNAEYSHRAMLDPNCKLSLNKLCLTSNSVEIWISLNRRQTSGNVTRKGNACINCTSGQVNYKFSCMVFQQIAFILPLISSVFCLNHIRSLHLRHHAIQILRMNQQYSIEQGDIRNASSYLGFKDRPHKIRAKPDGFLALSFSNFGKELRCLFESICSVGVDKDPTSLPLVLNLVLDNDDVTLKSKRRQGVEDSANIFSLVLYRLGCFFLDNFFNSRPIQRFWFLETIARIPYFSYVSMLHLYESLGKAYLLSQRAIL